MWQSQVPERSNYGSARSCRSISHWTVRRLQPMCHTRQASHHHAKRYPTGQKNPRRESLSHQKQTKITVLSGPPIPPKGDNLKSYPLNVEACKRKRLTLKNKIISVGSALSKQIPLKVNGFAETRNFPHLLR